MQPGSLARLVILLHVIKQNGPEDRAVWVCGKHVVQSP